MRSRYTAFTLGNMDWLAASHDPETRGAFDAAETRAWSAGNRWLGLTVLETEAGGAEDAAGRVAFEARYRRDGEEHVLAEDSRFRRVDGRWVYVEGSPLP